MRLPRLVINRFSAYFSKTNLATNGNMILIFLCALCGLARDVFDSICNIIKLFDFYGYELAWDLLLNGYILHREK